MLELDSSSKIFSDKGEERRTDPNTGAQKGVKLERFDLVPASALRALATVYGKGSQRYADRNWEAGYPWGWSFGALQRHLWAFWGGEYLDPETGLPHLAHAAWHCFTLIHFVDGKLGVDDRGLK